MYIQLQMKEYDSSSAIYSLQEYEFLSLNW